MHANWWVNGIMLKGKPVGRVYVVCQLTGEANAEISHRGHDSLLQVRFTCWFLASNSHLLVGLGGSEESAYKIYTCKLNGSKNELVTGW